MTNIVHVAAAVIQRADGCYLLAQRPADKIKAGYWEFPGGKIEPNETPHHALVRELKEELGIIVHTAYPWINRIYTYPHATVHLHFFRVTAWSGEIQSLEGQSFSWDKNVSPILAANAPILNALELPVLYGISNVKELGEDVFLQRLNIALERGLRLVQLREKDYSSDELKRLAVQMLPILHAYQAKLILNADIELAQSVGADGVQLNSSQLLNLTKRPDLPLCAASCHNAEELAQAEALGCDFAMLSPVLPTLSHPGAAHLGWQKFADICQHSTIPIYALGGLTHQDMETAWQHGAHGIALLRQAWQF